MEKELILDYQRGLTFNQLIDKYHITKYKIKKILVNNNIHIRIGRERVPFSDEQVKDIIDMYRNHSGINDISKKYNADYSVIKKLLLENNIETVQWKKINKKLKENFFETITTEEQAYLLGLFFTDGYVKKDGTIGIFLQESDIELIERIKEILQIDSVIQFDKREHKEAYGIEFRSKKIKEDLEKFGIIPNKTYLSKGIPKNIPEALQRHFFRGLFDGDGIFCLSSSDSSIGFCGYYKETVEDFQQHIDIIINKENHNKIRKQNAYQCSWKGKQQIIKILDYLYENANIYLDRKYQKYLKLKIT